MSHSEMPFSKPYRSRGFCLKTPKLRQPAEHRTVYSSCKFQRIALKRVKMANVKQGHLRRLRVFQKSYDVMSLQMRYKGFDLRSLSET